MPTIDQEKGTSIAAFGDLDAIGIHNDKTHEQFDFQQQADASIPFYLQGSDEFQATEALEQRKALKSSPRIKDGILRFWNVFPKHTVMHEDVISKDEYMQLMLLLFKVLRDDFEKHNATIQIEKDWIVDSKAKDSMNMTVFTDALFELVDMWTCDIEENTYVRFIDILFARISVRAIVFFDGTVIRVALDDQSKSLHELMAEAVPLATLSAFSHIARYMSDSTITTMGDLAKAKPEEIEQLRLDYIEKNQLSTEMFGSDLFQVLELLASAGTAKNLNSLVELTRAKPSLIDEARQAFLNARNISTTKQAPKSRVVEELAKFGIKVEALTSEQMIQDTYMTLCDLFVVKTGSEIIEMAKRDLKRIKIQLERHGMYVPEDMVEAKYKEYFETVIKTTGAQVVQGAKQWIADNSNEESLSEFIKKEYDEFKVLEDARAFTSDDSEFISLTAQDEDDDSSKEKGEKDKGKSLATRDISMVKSDKPPPPEKPKNQFNVNHPTSHQAPPKDTGNSNVPKAKKENSLPKNQPGHDNNDIHSAPINKNGSKNAAITGSLKPQVETIVVHTEPLLPSQDLYLTAETNSSLQQSVSMEPSEPLLVEIAGTDVNSDATPAEVKQNELQLDEKSTNSQTQSNIGNTSPRKNIIIQRDIVGQKKLSPKEKRMKKLKGASQQPKYAKIVVGGLTQGDVPTIVRYIRLLGFGDVFQAMTREETIGLCESNATDEGADIVCFVVGENLDEALPSLKIFKELVELCVIIIGGDSKDPTKTQNIAHECVAHGAIYFATMPVNFTALRSRMQQVLENSKQPYVFQRKQEKPNSALYEAMDKTEKQLKAIHDANSIEKDNGYVVSAGRKRSIARPRPSFAAPSDSGNATPRRV
ncbi:hypothetical protein Ae201684P_008919 [Aphanomyces euteiches]|nr:hypothetical protein Ae201684P_008919 [Aphanomyces euteiches]